ncbi:ATP-binding cassette domain-containing protein [Amycolatopsis sulphurea]|nr:ATP-binding cassette domain-containing protein [Amycolatopsis sulphurea]
MRALVGENGSGKSTLVKILAGYHTPDPGTHIVVNGQPVVPRHAGAGERAGLRFVHIRPPARRSTVLHLEPVQRLRTDPGGHPLAPGEPGGKVLTGYSTRRDSRITSSRRSCGARDARPPRGVCRTCLGSVKGPFTDSESVKGPFTDLRGGAGPLDEISSAPVRGTWIQGGSPATTRKR